MCMYTRAHSYLPVYIFMSTHTPPSFSTHRTPESFAVYFFSLLCSPLMLCDCGTGELDWNSSSFWIGPLRYVSYSPWTSVSISKKTPDFASLWGGLGRPEGRPGARQVSHQVSPACRLFHQFLESPIGRLHILLDKSSLCTGEQTLKSQRQISGQLRRNQMNKNGGDKL